MSHEVNLALCRLLGIETKRVTGFTLTVGVGHCPELVVTSLLTDGAAFIEKEQAFELHARDRSDLDAQCAAMQRVNQGITTAAKHASAVIRMQHLAAMARLETVVGPCVPTAAGGIA